MSVKPALPPTICSKSVSVPSPRAAVNQSTQLAADRAGLPARVSKYVSKEWHRVLSLKARSLRNNQGINKNKTKVTS